MFRFLHGVERADHPALIAADLEHLPVLPEITELGARDHLVGVFILWQAFRLRFFVDIVLLIDRAEKIRGGICDDRAVAEIRQE